ncbi:MAG: tripartite tricarboxylate transporter TctB family protein [Desulfobacterales bacterium]|nr:tripartite tricarboxylate transporter TctB family protein [Desulfobacterales bacterium]
MKSSTYSLMAIALLMLAVIVYAAGFQYFRAKAFPMVIAGIVLCLALVELAKDLRGRRAGKLAYEKQARQVGAKDVTGKYLIEGAWLAGFCLAVYLLGFLIALPLFGVSYLVSHGRRWTSAIAVGVATTVALYGIFFYLLEVSWYPGIILDGLGW